MIVVTGASGTVGSRVIQEAERKNIKVRALTRTPDSFPDTPNVEWVFADFSDPESLQKAFRDAEALILITPAHKDMFEHQKLIVDEAVSAGIRKIAKLSGLGAGPDANIRLPKEHYQIEQYIKSKGVDYAFVRPNLFMQVVLGSADSIRSERVIYAPAGSGPISFTDAQDVARVLLSEAKKGGSSVVEITGPEAISYQQAAEKIGHEIGGTISHVDVSDDQARAAMKESGMDDWLVEAFIELFRVYREGMGSSVFSQAIEESTGVRASDFRAFVKANREQFL